MFLNPIIPYREALFASPPNPTTSPNPKNRWIQVEAGVAGRDPGHPAGIGGPDQDGDDIGNRCDPDRDGDGIDDIDDPWPFNPNRP